jgi:hypothetical protein
MATRQHGSRPATINLRAGGSGGTTYFLAAALELTAADSGLTIQTYPGDHDTAWLSGGAELPRGIQWKRVTAVAGATATAAALSLSANIWSADLSSVSGLPAEGVRSLRVGGSRAILARYPNCNPETELCFKPGQGVTTTLAETWQSVGGQPKGEETQQKYTAPEAFSRRFCNDTSDRGCGARRFPATFTWKPTVSCQARLGTNVNRTATHETEGFRRCRLHDEPRWSRLRPAHPKHLSLLQQVSQWK